MAEAEHHLSAADIWAGAKSLRDFLTQRSAEIEQARRLTPEVVAALHEKGLFRLNMPQSWGGPEMTSMEQVEVIEEISRADASVGWCLMIGCDTGLYSGYLQNSVARALYPRLDMVQAGWVVPAGQAHETSDGYIVKNSRWAFGSGCTHADLIAGGCTVYKDGEPKLMPNGIPASVNVIAPADQWEILDTWYTTGLRGTGSNDYTTKEAEMFVPREHTFSWYGFADAPRREGVLWMQPDTLLRKMAGIPLGVARSVIDYAVDILQDKVEMPAGKPYRANTRIQAAVAEAEMKLGAARSYVFSSLHSQWATLEAGQELSKQQRADVWIARINAFQTAREVANLIYDTVGGSAIYANKGPIDRAVRDTTTMCQHIVGQRKSLEPAGALLLGEEGGTHALL